MAQIGPEFMYSTRPAKKGLSERSESVLQSADSPPGDGWRQRTVLLEVGLAGRAELDSSELEAAVLEAGDDGANESTL
jgi:hypothetical protein